MSCLNKKNCRQLLLKLSEDRWPGWPKRKKTQVTKDVFTFLETSLRTDMQELIRQQPSSGKTIIIPGFSHKQRRKE